MQFVLIINHHFENLSIIGIANVFKYRDHRTGMVYFFPIFV